MKWLDENVQCYPTPKKVMLSEFEIDWRTLSGSFRVDLDGVQLPKRFRFGVELTDRPTLFFPMFHSPCGVPASFAAIEITDRTETAILEGLRRTIPAVRPYGVDHKTGKDIDSRTPLSKRILDRKQFESAKRRVNLSGYSISVDIEHAP